jgi:hypothetical protein
MVALWVCAAAPLIFGVGLIGGQRCDSDDVCLSGSVVNDFGISLVALGGVLIAVGFLSAAASFPTRWAKPAIALRKWAFGLAVVAALMSLVFAIASTPSLNT